MFRIKVTNNGRGGSNAWRATLRWGNGSPLTEPSLEGLGATRETAIADLREKTNRYIQGLQSIDWRPPVESGERVLTACPVAPPLVPVRPGQGFVNVCFDCAHAERANVVIDPIPDWEVCSAWQGRCDCCGEEKGIADVRDFGRPWHRPLKEPKPKV